VLYDLGQRDFGESRWQEASEKIEFLPKDIRWHFLGPLQANKARVVGENFSVIHSLTNSRQLDEICKASKSIDGFVEVNIAKERQKAGVPVETLDEIVNIVVECKCVRFQGLMAIGPQTSNREVIRECFREIAVLNRRFQGKCLSMGMSEDFDVAIMEGSTHVRIGSALFSGV
jgi:pyridoxal phosphate enzyme (YggS family)